MQLTRRDFIKLTGASAGGVAASGILGSPTSVLAAEDALAILYDPSKCIGCRACQMACKQWNNLPPESSDPDGIYEAPTSLSATTWNIIKLNERIEPEHRLFNYQCMHCVDAACVLACPSGALYKDEQGFTAYDRNKCIGCGYCAQWCPYDVPHLEEENLLTGKGKAAKCTFCQDRIQEGIGGPSCVERCPVGALTWGPRETLLAEAQQRVETLKTEGLDSARVYGEVQSGGLNRLSILFAEPEAYNLPADTAAPAVARVWQSLIQGIGAVAIVVAGLGAFGAFLLSRGKITMEEVE
ncbi:MAG: 4Fe-4S dicluster domain-containing protein [Anaerolineae bacterium]|nr:4Fe-4S dicluster domain-containing protein [Anaerolineae bacterium]